MLISKYSKRGSWSAQKQNKFSLINTEDIYDPDDDEEENDVHIGREGGEVICLPAPGILPKKTENIFIDRDWGLTKTSFIKVIPIPFFSYIHFCC